MRSDFPFRRSPKPLHLVGVAEAIVNPLSAPRTENGEDDGKLVANACNMACGRVEHLTNLSPRAVGRHARMKTARPRSTYRTGMQGSIHERRKFVWGAILAASTLTPSWSLHS